MKRAFRECNAPKLIPECLREFDRDPNQLAWTEGLQWYNGVLYESTGSPTGPSGGSARVSVDSGMSQLELEGGSVKIKKRFSLPFQYFGEGMARNGDKLYQLAKDSETVLVYELEPFQKLPDLPRAAQKRNERWGLCFSPLSNVFYLSDGSSTLKIYAKDQFEAPNFAEPVGTLPITCNTRPIYKLNSLEFANSHIYAAVMDGDQSNRIVKIDPTTGFVTAQIDASNLRECLYSEKTAHLEQDVNTQAKDLNGIAYQGTDPEDNQEVFFVTGKFWPKIFKVKFIPES